LSEDTPQKDLTGSELAGWVVEKKLGQGAMGAVYRAHDRTDPSRVVALKVIRPEVIDDRMRARFVREGKAVSRIDHENCCRCLGQGEVDGLQWLALEFIEGKPLDNLLEERGPLKVSEAVGYLKQVLSGLAGAHEAGVIHRDVKPANMIVTSAGVLKLVDFGLARRANESMLLTAKGALLGTPYYMSPEQCRGEDTDARSDLYAAGAVAFHFLTGRGPFVARSTSELLRKHVSEPVPSLRTFRDDVPAPFEQLVTRLLAKKPEERFPDARAALAALAAVALPKAPAAAPAPTNGASVAASRVPSPVAAFAETVKGPAPDAAAIALAGRQRLLQAGGMALATFVLVFALVKVAAPAAAVWLPVLLGAGAAAAAFKVATTVRDAAPRSGLASQAATLPPPGGPAPVGSAQASAGSARTGSVGSARTATNRAPGGAETVTRAGPREAEAKALIAANQPARAAEIYVELRQLALAAELFEKAGDVPRAVETYQAAGKREEAAIVLERVGRIDEAARLLAERAAELEVQRGREKMPARVARIDSELAVIVDRASKLYRRSGTPAEGAVLLARLGNHREAAELYLEAGDRAQAVAELIAGGDRVRAAEVHERAGDAAAAARIRAEGLVTKGERRTAALELERAGDHLRAARLFEDEGEIAQAADLYDRGGEKARAATLFERTGRHARAGELYERLGKMRDAARCFRGAGDARREAAALSRAGDFFGAGVACMDGGLDQEALAEFRRVPAGSSDHAAAQARIEAITAGRGGVTNLGATVTRVPRATGRSSSVETVLEDPHRAAFRAEATIRDEANPGAATTFRHASTLREEAGSVAGFQQAATLRETSDSPGPDDEARAWIGKVVDRYRIVDFLGAGAFAYVFRAEHVHLERPAALKVLRSTYAKQADVTKRFLAEAKVVSRLKHPAIVEVHDFGEAAGSFYMALEHVDGVTLRKTIEERAPLSVAEAIAIVQSILGGLEVAHKSGVVHRDLKPENVLVDRRGGVHVLDFGMARAFWADIRTPGASAGFAGTPRYASPEAVIGKEVDARADQYAAGLILYELATKDFPFASDSSVGFLHHHAHTVPVAPSERRPDLPFSRLFDRTVLKALEKNPEARYPGVGAFAAALATIK
jgi:serine/threonine-protein kinase